MVDVGLGICWWGDALEFVQGLALATVVVGAFTFALLDGFQGELDFAVEGGKVGFELLELVFFFPCSLDNFPEDGECPLKSFPSLFGMLQKRGNGFEGAEEHLGSNLGVFCQLAAVEVIEDVYLHLFTRQFLQTIKLIRVTFTIPFSRGSGNLPNE